MVERTGKGEVCALNEEEEGREEGEKEGEGDGEALAKKDVEEAVKEDVVRPHGEMDGELVLSTFLETLSPTFPLTSSFFIIIIIFCLHPSSVRQLSLPLSSFPSPLSSSKCLPTRWCGSSFSHGMSEFGSYFLCFIRSSNSLRLFSLFEEKYSIGEESLGGLEEGGA